MVYNISRGGTCQTHKTPSRCKDNNFVNDLKFGQQFELLAQQKICEKYNVTIENINNDSGYDFKTSDGIKYEVKADRVTKTTGNFYIEFFNVNKNVSSGINTTKADFYILSDTVEFYMISTPKLIMLCDEFKDITKINKNMGAVGVLIPVASIIHHSIRI